MKKQKKINLEKAVNLALQNNYDLNLQRAAVLEASSLLKQKTGETDIIIGADASYSLNQNPVDSDDKESYVYGYSWIYDSDPASEYDPYGLYTENVTQSSTNLSFFLQKLFSFGLNTKLSYTIQRQKSTTDFSYANSETEKKCFKYL